MADAGDKPVDIRCPRCGYDQRGVIDTWTEHCPLEGRCTECGLEFLWDEVIRAELYEPTWHVEYCPRRRILWATISTFFRSCWPWWYWKRLKMSHEVKWRRIATYVLMVLLWMFIPYAIIQSTAAIYVRNRSIHEFSTYQTTAVKMAARTQNTLGSLPSDESEATEENLRSIEWLVGPLGTTEIIDPETGGWVIDQNLRKSQYHDRLSDVRSDLTRQLRNWQGVVTTTATFPTAAECIFYAVFLPLSSNQIGNPLLYFPSPVQFWNVILSDPNLRSISNLARMIPQTFAGMMISITATMFMGASFLLLPVSRKRAKVRWRHVVRPAIYSLNIMAVAFAVSILILSVMILTNSSSAWGITLAGLSPAWLGVIWWGAIMKHYHRIPHGYLTALVLMFLCTVAAASVLSCFVRG